MLIPLSLYIHIPWCVKKCPYCDFNSHTQKGTLPEALYIDQLIKDAESQRDFIQNRPIHSIFIGGGTPSLFSPAAYQLLFEKLRTIFTLPSSIEITLEANPGTTEAARFEGYLKAGINRLSLGVQSFQEDKLQILGRIHAANDAKNAVKQAQSAGFERINIDLMFGLPNQTMSDARYDLETALALAPTHLSWYQLTLEPNTYFHRFPPILPSDDKRFDIQQAGHHYLQDHGFQQYEISAYGKINTATDELDRCQHNVNYWQFGDYIGIGAGAHGKVTDHTTGDIFRRMPPKNPKDYLTTAFETVHKEAVSREARPLEFLMNAFRLYQPISIALFEERTGMPIQSIQPQLKNAINLGLLEMKKDQLIVTPHGRLFLNELLEVFL